MRSKHLRTNTEDNNFNDINSKSKKKLQILINEHDINSLQNLKSNNSGKKRKKKK
jgi:hypothetical protein